MEERTYPETIPYVVHEDHMCMMERTIKRLWILCIIIFLALIGTNAGWIYYENQFEDIVITQDGKADNDGNVTLSGVGSGSIYNYGESETDNQNSQTEDGR